MTLAVCLPSGYFQTAASCHEFCKVKDMVLAFNVSFHLQTSERNRHPALLDHVLNLRIVLRTDVPSVGFSLDRTADQRIAN